MQVYEQARRLQLQLRSIKPEQQVQAVMQQLGDCLQPLWHLLKTPLDAVALNSWMFNMHQAALITY